MLLRIVVSPDASWGEVSFACDQLGVQSAVYRSNGTSERREPAHHRYLGPLRVLYTEDPQGLRRSGVLTKLEESKKFKYLVILGCVPDKFTTCVVNHGSVLELVLSSLDLSASPTDRMSWREPDHHARLIDSFQRDSILSRVSQLLYRIRDKTERSQVSAGIYRYLSGAVKRPPKISDPKILNDTLRSDLARRYNEAGQRVLSGEDIDLVCGESNIDRFDVAYCIRKSTTNAAVLDSIAFKE